MDMNRIVAASFFEPVKEFDVVATIVCKVTGIMVNRNKFNCLFAFFYSFNKDFSAVYCFTSRPFMKTISRQDSNPRWSANVGFGGQCNRRYTALLYKHPILRQLGRALTINLIRTYYTKKQLSLLDFYNKHIIGRLSSATSNSLSPSISFILRIFYYSLAQYHATLCLLKAEFTLGKFLVHPHFQRQNLLLGPSSLLRQQRTHEVGKEKGIFILFLSLSYIYII